MKDWAMAIFFRVRTMMNAETWSISLVDHLLYCWRKVLSDPTSLNGDSKLPVKSKTANLKMLSPYYKSEPLNLLNLKI